MADENEKEKYGCYETARASVCGPGINTLYPPHPKPLRLWAAGIGVPLRFSSNDPRLPNPGGGDTTQGQDGWDVALDFSTLSNLASQLDGGFSLPSHSCGNYVFSCGPIGDNQITKLAINAHGGPGLVDIDNAIGRDVDNGWLNDPKVLSATTVPTKKADLDKILKKLGWRATVYLMCCLSGESADGEKLLNALSTAWAAKEITVVGFRSILYCNTGKGGQYKSQGDCYAGCRETHYSNISGASRPYNTPAVWNDLKLLPWASATSPHARVSKKGAITRAGAASNPWGACQGTH